jgi:hypothetical protein
VPSRVRCWLPLLLAAALAGAGSAGADLVVLVDGGVLKVDRFTVRGDRAELDFPGGGSLTLELARVERVVDDEIDPAAEPSHDPLAEAAPEFPVHFAESDRPPGTPWSGAIFAAARRHGLNPRLVAAVVRAESDFDPSAVSNKGARGLMQLMPATGRRFGLSSRELFDPIKNLDAGARYLAWLADRFDDDLARILAGYHAGEGAVERFDGIPPYRDTRRYVRSVYSLLGLSVGGVAAR